jgi:hypothetical protein
MLRLTLREDKGPPFGDSEASAHGDDDEVESATPIRHFRADPIPSSEGVTEIVLLPSGVLGEAPPVVYVWRAPEELAYESHGATVPAGRTRIVGVLLQGEVQVGRAEACDVLFVWPRAWAGEQPRMTRALVASSSR